MFHIVNNDDFENAIKNLSNILKNNGFLIIGGEFGNENKYLHFIDDGKPIKQLRSYKYWETILNKYNLKIIKNMIIIVENIYHHHKIIYY